MKTSISAVLVWGATVGLFSALAVNAVNASGADDKKTIAALDTEYQAAVRKNDAATMDRILADDFVLVIGDGKTYTKADLVNETRAGHAVYEHQEDTEQTVRVWGDTEQWSQRSCGRKAQTAESLLTTYFGSVTLTCARLRDGDMCLVKLLCR